MRKTLLSFGLVGMALFLSGCGKQDVKQQDVSSAGQEKQTVQSEQKNDSIVSSIKDAMGMGKQMKCTYNIKNNDATIQSVAYVEGKKFKSTSTVAGKNASMLFDGNDMYTWVDGQKTGMKMSKACMDEFNNAAGSQKNADVANGAQTPDQKFDNAMDVNCVASTDADFSLPAGVTFTDQCEMMKKATDATKDMKDKIPANVQNMPGVPKL